MTKLHVVMLPSWFPSAHSSVNGIFIAEQARLLARYVTLGVVYPDLRSARQLRPSTIAAQHFQTREELDDGVRVVRQLGWNVPRPRVQAALYLRPALRMLRSYIRRHGRPDLLHAHSVFWGGHAASVAARELGIPYLVTEHWSGYGDGEVTAWQGTVATRVFREAGAVVCVSKALANALESYVGGREVGVIANPIDTDFFDLPHEPPPKHPFTVVTIAGLREVKRLDLLLTAFAAAFGPRQGVQPGSVPSARLLIGGGGPEHAALLALAKRLGIEEQVELAGPVSREGVRRIVHLGHVFVSSSRTETFGMAIAEAQAAGLPVIATRSGGAEEILSAESGVLVPVDDTRALTEALLGLARHGWSGAGPSEIRAGIVGRFRSNAVAEQILAVYERVRAAR